MATPCQLSNNSDRKYSTQLPPFKLSKDLPCSDLLNIITKTSNIAKETGYLISFKSEQIFIQNNNIKFMVTLAKNLAKKPKPKISENEFKDPFIAPFDIGCHVIDLNNEYKILLNKFNVVPNHILIITSNFVKQTLPLIAKDFDITMKVILSMNGLCYFNSGPFSGASQPHKHIQIIPRNYNFPMEQSQKILLWSDLATNQKGDKQREIKMEENTKKIYTCQKEIIVIAQV
eukprot:136689_1